MKNPVLFSIAFLALVAVPAVNAQDGAAYYGVSFGEFDYDEAFPLNRVEDTASSWRLMVNYQFMEYLAVEGGLGQTGTLRDTVIFPTGPGSTIDLSYSAEVSRIFTVRLLGTLPFDNGIKLMGGLGYSDMKFEFDLTDGVDTASFDETTNEPGYYFGVQYDWDRFAMRLGYEKFDLDGDRHAAETMLSFFYKL